MSRTANIVLWLAQAALAALFLFAGGMKLTAPAAALAAQSPIAPALLKAIGALEVLGALGLVLPGIFRIRPGLTPLAAAGLVLIMCGATGATLAATVPAAAPALAAIPALVGALAAAVAWGRMRTTA